MLLQVAGSGRAMVIAAAVMSPLVSHLALATGWGFTVALPLAALQAVAAGLILWGTVPARLRPLAVLAPVALLTALGAGAWHAAPTGLLAAAGLSHAMLHAGLLTVFGLSLAPLNTPLVTRIARRLNPSYHSGMDGYTRGVTVAWCLFFAGQIVVSSALLLLAPETWGLFVTVMSLPLALMAAAVEYCIRRRRFAGMPHPGVLTMVRGARSLRAPAFGTAPAATAAPPPHSRAGDASG